MSEKLFIVHHENGGRIQVYAKDKEDAVEAFYESLKSMIGHALGACDCYKEPKPLDRSKLVRITKIEGPFESDVLCIVKKEENHGIINP